MDVLRGNVALLRRVRALVDLDVAFLALESRLFSLGRPGSSLPQMHAEGGNAREEMSIVSERLMETCQVVAPTLDWTIRCDAASTASKTIASLVKEQLETARIERRTKLMEKGGDDANAKEDEQEDDDRPTKATLLVVDRAADLVSPLVHEFSYQAMVHDLLTLNYRKPGGAHLEVPDERNEEKTKSIQLDDEEKDPVWTDIRSMFIEEAHMKAQDSFKKFLETDAAFKIRGKGAGDVDIKDMSAAVRSLPDSQMRADKHAMHIKAARECLDICSKEKLTDLALVEQDLLVGRHSDGTKIRPEAMMESITEILGDNSVPTVHRARLVMIALVIAEGLPGLRGENSALANSATFRSKILRSEIVRVAETESLAVSSLMGLQKVLEIARTGFQNYESQRNPHSDLDDKDTVAAKLKQKYAHRRAVKQQQKDSAVRRKRHGLLGEDELEYDVARYHPPLRSVMMDLIDDELDKDAFPPTGFVSVDSIIASLGESSVSEQSMSEGRTQRHDKAGLRYGATTIRAQSASVAGMVKSLGRGDSHHSAASEDDRFRLAESGHLYVVFVVGGVCYSEVRAMYEVCAKREANILIGGSAVLTPNTFMEALGAVADPVLRIRVMLPPLPIELAMSRAARAKTLEVGRAKESSGQGSARGKGYGEDSSPTSVSLDGAVGSQGDENQQEAEVEVVVGYKKSRGKRLFGRKKK